MAESKGGDYYFALGRRVPLKADAGVAAVALDRARGPDVPRGVVEQLERLGTPLRAGVVLVDAATLAAADRKLLDEAGALFPVFDAAGGRVVVTPEVRVEGDAAAMEIVRALLREHGVDRASISDEGVRLTFQARSGAEALHLANDIHERAHATLAQPRFIRVVPKPGRSSR